MPDKVLETVKKIMQILFIIARVKLEMGLSDEEIERWLQEFLIFG
jgi:hypothetical protein